MVSVVLVKILNLIGMGFCNSYYLYLPLRYLNGFTDVFFAIYIPVWIDQYAPKNRNSVMMSFHHIESLLGTILGFGATTLISINFDWRYTFFLQAILSSVFWVILLFIKKKYFCRTMTRIGENSFVIKNNLESNIFKRVDISNKFTNDSNNNDVKNINDYDVKSLDTLKSEAKSQSQSQSQDINIIEEYGNVLNKDVNEELIGSKNEIDNERKESEDKDEEIVEVENNLTYIQIIIKILSNKVSF